MSLQNDFYVADAHVVAYQELVKFVTVAGQMANTPAIKAALDHAPEQATKGRSFLQITLDDAMDGFANVMARTIKSSNVTFEDVPHEFYLKLMRDRHGPKVTKQESKDQLKNQIDIKLKQQHILNRSEMPMFLR